MHFLQLHIRIRLTQIFLVCILSCIGTLHGWAQSTKPKNLQDDLIGEWKLEAFQHCYDSTYNYRDNQFKKYRYYSLDKDQKCSPNYEKPTLMTIKADNIEHTDSLKLMSLISTGYLGGVCHLKVINDSLLISECGLGGPDLLLKDREVMSFDYLIIDKHLTGNLVFKIIDNKLFIHKINNKDSLIFIRNT
jgi:hypothetical protein